MPAGRGWGHPPTAIGAEPKNRMEGKSHGARKRGHMTLLPNEVGFDFTLGTGLNLAAGAETFTPQLTSRNIQHRPGAGQTNERSSLLWLGFLRLFFASP